MRRGLHVIVAALVVLGSVAEAQSAEVVGPIAAMDTASRTLVIRVEPVGDRERRVRWNPQTLFVIRGRPGAARDLRPGQRVRVQLQVSGSGRVRDVARRVVVLPDA